MQDIELQAIKTYDSNMKYFSKQHSKLANKINKLNITIENGSYTPKYDLEYIKSYFDVKELKSKQYLYADDSNKISKELTKLVNYQKDSYTFEGFPIFKNYEDKELKANGTDEGYEGLFPIMSYYANNSSPTDEMKIIEKFIFIGTGLGLHLPLIDDNINAERYLIIEDNLELFKLSLFTTPYYQLAKNKTLHFSIAEDNNSFLTTVRSFLENSFFQNKYLKYSYFPAHSDTKIKQIQNAIATQYFIIFPYKTILRKVLRPLEFINDGYHVLNLTKHFTNSIFSTKPILLIAAGPSLGRHISWLKENHTKFILVAVSATLNTLYKNNIVPDIVTHIDGFYASVDHYDNFPAKDFLKDSIFLAGPFTPLAIKDMFKKDNIFYYEEDTQYFKDYSSMTSGCVGSTSLLNILTFNAKEVYLLGLDLALNQKTGQTHSTNHFYEKNYDLSKKNKLSSNTSLHQNVFPVKGNFTDQVSTVSLYNISIQSLYNKIPLLKHEDQTIFNLSDGAYFNKTIPKHVKDIDINTYPTIDKKELFKQIYKTLNQHSSIQLDKNDIISLKQRLQHTQEIKKYINKYKDNASHTNADNYFYNLIKIISVLLRYSGREFNNLTVIYSYFFSYALPIVIDFLNTKKLKNTKRHIKKLDELLIKEMIEIANIYEKSLESFIKEKC